MKINYYIYCHGGNILPDLLFRGVPDEGPDLSREVKKRNVAFMELSLEHDGKFPDDIQPRDEVLMAAKAAPINSPA